MRFSKPPYFGPPVRLLFISRYILRYIKYAIALNLLQKIISKASAQTHQSLVTFQFSIRSFVKMMSTRLLLVTSLLWATEALNVSKNARCGSVFGLTCAGSTFGRCCSQYGYVSPLSRRASTIANLFAIDTVEAQRPTVRQAVARKAMDLAMASRHPT